jgi:hypothetical protein
MQQIPETATSSQLFTLQSLMRKHDLLPEKKSYDWFVPDWHTPPEGTSASSWAGELLTLQGVGKQQVGEAINLLVSCRSQLDRRLFWRTLGLNPPTQREVGQITGRVERTIVRKASKTADPVTEATKPPKSTPAEPFNPALPKKVDVSQALLGLSRRSK